jgi:hypothetical protein
MASFGIFKNAKAKNVGNSFVAVYSAPVGKEAYFLQLDISSTGNTGVQVSLVVNDGVDDVYLGRNIPVPVGSTLEYVDSKKVVLEGTETLKVKCETTGEVVDVFCSIVEDVNA